MPYTRSKNKKQTRIIKGNVNVKQNKEMRARLMVISLKADEYIYNKKPISTQEADMYVREMEAFKNQSSDERYLQVIEKLTSYMKCIIREQSPRDIMNLNMTDPKETFINQSVAENEVALQNSLNSVKNAIIDKDIQRSFSNLSIIDFETPCAISDVNIKQKISDIDNYSSTLINEDINEVKSNKVNNINEEKRNNKIEVSNLNPVDLKLKEKVDDNNEQSQNILSNFSYEHNASLNTLRNIRISGKLKQQILEDAATKIDEYNNTNIKLNSSLQSETSRDALKSKEIKMVDDLRLSQQSPNLSPFANKIGTGLLRNNTNHNYHQAQYDENETNFAVDTVNRHVNLEALEQKELGYHSIELSHKIPNLNTGKNAATCVYQNYSLNYQPLHCEIPKHTITDDRHKTIRSNNMNTSNTFTISNLKDTQDNTIIKNNTKQKEKNLRKEKTTIKRTYNRKNKVNIGNTASCDLNKESAVVNMKTQKKSMKNSKQSKNQIPFIKKKTNVIDITWIENIKFVRAIESDEYFKINDLEESFWVDASLPSGISMADFENNNINIWKN